MSTCLQIFARAPIAGQVKTRLIPAIGGHGAAELYRGLVERTVNTAASAGFDQLEIHVAGEAGHPYLAGLADSHGAQLRGQHGDDLGERMANALVAGLQRHRKVVLIGTDCPGYSQEYLRSALDALEQQSDIVFGPAEDGGYVLVAASRVHPSLFADIEWGSDRVLEQSIRRAEALGFSYRLLTMLWDIDRPGDLHRFDALREE